MTPVTATSTAVLDATLDSTALDSSAVLDAAVVGAGFAGMYMLHQLRQNGFSARSFERASDVGGTWFWNRYPGARCDVESVEYSYKFSEELQQEWVWTERYATQPEILSYANHVADRFDLRRDVTFDTTVIAAVFDEENNLWTISTSSEGKTTTHQAKFLIMATGCLSSPNSPTFRGGDTFEGQLLHTGDWPTEPVDFTGKRVGVIGTGSSAIQSIPIIASEADSLTVFQRSANYTIPAHNRPLDAGEQESIKAQYSLLREANEEMTAGFGSRYPRNEVATLDATPEQRQEQYEDRWAVGGLSFLGAFNDPMLATDANVEAANFVRSKVTEVVEDPATAELLSPKLIIGCKRLCVDSGYWETFNRDNVTLVDVSDSDVSDSGISEITPAGLTANGAQYEFDIIVLATGFDAMTGALLKTGIVGRNAQPLTEAWNAGPVNYLGLCVKGFPNMFTITGPGSPSVLTNMLTSIQQHVEWITGALTNMRDQGLSVIEAEQEAQTAWVSHVNNVADATLFPTCNSWYRGANVPGKPQVFMPLLGYPDYKAKCVEVVANNYEGFILN